MQKYRIMMTLGWLLSINLQCTSPTESKGGAEYFPLNTGNVWYYRAKLYGYEKDTSGNYRFTNYFGDSLYRMIRAKDTISLPCCGKTVNTVDSIWNRYANTNYHYTESQYFIANGFVKFTRSGIGSCDVVPHPLSKGEYKVNSCFRSWDTVMNIQYFDRVTHEGKEYRNIYAVKREATDYSFTSSFSMLSRGIGEVLRYHVNHNTSDTVFENVLDSAEIGGVKYVF